MITERLNLFATMTFLSLCTKLGKNILKTEIR